METQQQPQQPKRSQCVYLGKRGMERLERLVKRLESRPSDVVRRALLELEEKLGE